MTKGENNHTYASKELISLKVALEGGKDREEIEKQRT